MTVTAQPGTAAVTDAAAAAAAVLPAAVPLTAGPQQPLALLAPATFAGAAVATLDGSSTAHVAVLVQQSLVEALAASPMGELDLAAAVQPALDAAAASLGSSAGPARTTEVDEAVALLGGTAQAVPLLHEGATHAAVLVTVPAPSDATSAAPSGPSVSPLAAQVGAGLEMLHGVEMQVTVEIGRTRMSVRQLLNLAPGDVLELDRAAGSPADLLVNGRFVARGEIVVVDENFALRVTEILPAAG